MSLLPIDDVLAEIKSALSTHSQLILSAPPGAGKSTRLPQFLLDEHVVDGKIIMLEPRRLAARNIAAFLASQRGEQVGETIGLRMRGETKVSKTTRLEIVTEGVMTRMLQADPALEGVGLLIFDEFHERNLHADLSLALALDVQGSLRDDLKLLVMSATLDNHALQSLLPDAASLHSDGRMFPVEYRYRPVSRQRDWALQVARETAALMRTESGSALVFLPGAKEIRQVANVLSGLIAANTEVHTLFGKLSLFEQQRAIAPAPAGKRKVVLATNIAETSLTIEGIRLVVDCGLERRARFNAKAGFSMLETGQVAKSSAIQRAGRAGRTQDGHCLRLYTEETFQRMVPSPSPDITQQDLSGLVMELTQWGCSPEDLRWLDLPPTKHWQVAVSLLQWLSVLDKDAKLTALGHETLSSHAEPRFAAMLATAKDWGEDALSTACWLAAWGESPLLAGQGIDMYEHLLQCFSSHSHTKRAQTFAQQVGISLEKVVSSQWLPLLAASAWPDRIAMKRGCGDYLLSSGHGVSVDRNDPLSDHPGLVVTEMVASNTVSRAYSAIALDLSSLEQCLPDLLKENDHLDWDDNKGRLIAEQRICCGSLVLAVKASPEPSAEMATEALLNAVRRRGISSLNWSDRALSLLTRARCAQEWSLDLALPELSDHTLLEEIDLWLAPFMAGVTHWQSLLKLDLYKVLEAYLGWNEVSLLDQWLPTHYEVPTGSRYPIRYESGQKPVLAVKMQEMYGESGSPAIAEGKIKLQLELLSPAGRPLQITQDLAGFWAGSYREVQKEMKGRYPKHIWPDDPANHQATRKTKRHFQG